MKKKSALVILLIVSLSLAGCFAPITLPPKKLYTLNPSGIKIKTYRATNNTLLILPTQASDDIDNKKMAYVQKRYQLSYFSEHGWAAEPASLINTLIANALRQTKFFKAVVITPFIGTTNLKLATSLSVLQQNFTVNPSQEQFQLSAQLINANTGKVIAEKTFNYSIKTQYNNPYGGVIAANQAVKMMLQSLTEFVIKYS